jgi:ring-1,2-phenylacetyl-CoA epoxidase subunit PaaE
VTAVREALLADGVPADAVHTELFHADAPPPAPAVAAGTPGATVDVTLGGLRSSFALAPGEVVLDGLLRLRGDAPYACQGGVCGTCRARLVEGEVTMAATWALEPDELARGDVLTCQARAASAHLVLDFEG